MDHSPDCAFCRNVLTGADRVLLDETPHVVAFHDAYPSAENHTLVIPRRHVARLLDLDAGEYHDLWEVAHGQLRRLAALGADGFTVGVNDGPAAGQTVPHAHLHLIPRCHGDTSQARGGLRWVLPDTAVYWESGHTDPA
jgi:diadenosine tetraphosphate (Ap4A) HIT family hydrolase